MVRFIEEAASILRVVPDTEFRLLDEAEYTISESVVSDVS